MVNLVCCCVWTDGTTLKFVETVDFEVLEMKFLDKVLDANVTVFIDRLSVLWRKSKPAMGCLFTGTRTNETNVKPRMSLGEHFFRFSE